jgi:hypothetical protein
VSAPINQGAGTFNVNFNGSGITQATTTTLYFAENYAYSFKASDAVFLIHGNAQSNSPTQVEYGNGTGSVAYGGALAGQITGYFYDPYSGVVVTGAGTSQPYYVDSLGNEWAVSYDADYQTGQFTGDNDVAFVAVNPLPEASTMTMLSAAALMGLGYAGFRRLRQRKHDSAE